MYSSNNLLTIIKAIKSAPKDKKDLVLKEALPLIEIIIMNTSVLSDLISSFINENSKNIEAHTNAIYKRSEDSANKIIDAACNISQNISSLPEIQKKEIEKSINEIYEGCNFQDLVSQHTKEIDQSIKYLLEEMAYMKKMITSPATVHKEIKPVKESREKGHLLNGPKTDFSH